MKLRTVFKRLRGLFSFRSKVSSSVEREANLTTPDKDRRWQIILCLFIFLLALSARFLQWQDHHLLAADSYIWVSEYYASSARHLLSGNLRLFLCGPAPPTNASVLAHPPGYAILIAIISALSNNPAIALQIFQILCDATSAVLVFLIAREVLYARVGVIAGLLVAFSPQLGFYSMLLLPDSLIALPILLAFLFILCASKQQGLIKIVLAGAALGLSCWLRPNALLLAPFLALTLSFLFKRGTRLRSCALVCAAAFAVILPITIRNIIVFHHFIPLSLGSGVTLSEGIADYDYEGRFGFVPTDDAVMRQEAQASNRPDYLNGLYTPDGIEREQARRSRGLAVIRSHPFWFFMVMLRRDLSMFKADNLMPEVKVRPEPPVKRSVTIPNESQPVWSLAPAEISSNAVFASNVKIGMEDGGKMFHLVVDNPSAVWMEEMASAQIPVSKQTTYILRIPVKINQGRLIVTVASPDQATELTSFIMPDPVEVKYPLDYPEQVVEIPFSSGNLDEVCVRVKDGGWATTKLDVMLGRMEMFTIGPDRFMWTRYPRIILRAIQQGLMTEWLLPFSALGIVLLLISKRPRAVLTLMAVPLYYLSVQSALHVENRYVLTMSYFLMILAAVPVDWLIGTLSRILLRRKNHEREAAGASG